MTVPTVSVVIPTYNRGWGLRRAIDSVLGQTFTDFELVITDDASPDDTEAVVRSFTDPRIRYHRQPANVGVARNWGAGLDLARGDFVTLLMDDDRYEPGFLAARVAALRNHPSALFAFSGYRLAGPDGLDMGAHTPPLPLGVLQGPDLFRAALAKHCFVGATMYRTAPIRGVWAEAARRELVVDFAANLRLTACADVSAIYLDTLDFVMARHPSQISESRKQEVYALAAAEMEQWLAGPHPQWVRACARQELVSWLTVWGRAAAARGERRKAMRCLLRAVRLRPASATSWRQLLRLMVGL